MFQSRLSTDAIGFGVDLRVIVLLEADIQGFLLPKTNGNHTNALHSQSHDVTDCRMQLHQESK